MSLTQFYRRSVSLLVCLFLLAMTLAIATPRLFASGEAPPAPPDAPAAPLCENRGEERQVDCLPAIYVGVTESINSATTETITQPTTPVAFDCGAVSEIPQIECQALIAFYNSTNGPNWSRPEGWLNSNTPCKWGGIECGSGHVIGFGFNYLECLNQPQCTQFENHFMGSAGGTLPPELGNLSELQYFNLAYATISGSLPSQFGALSKLEILQIGNTNLAGHVPVELGNLSNLEYLRLYNNQLTGSIPAQLGNLGKLTNLYLWGNQLTGPIPTELGQLSQLIYIYFSGNELTGAIPPQLGNLSNLQVLSLWDNQLSGSIPGELGQLSKLVELSINQNQLTGSIPAQLGNLSDLQKIYLFGNQLSGPLPPELGQLSKLITLSAGSNQLTGSIPAELGQLSKLTDLSLSQNQLTGSIPVQLSNLANLEDLSLWRNQLTGPIPPELGQLSKLTDLSLSQNQLTGSIPAQLGDLANLQQLYLWGNQFTGPIPPELGQLSQLVNIYFSGNELTGSIPSQLGNLPNLEVLSLWNNQLSGSIPGELGQLSKLAELSIYQNQLTGSIPAQLGNLSKLTALYLNDNQLTGPIPAQLGNLANLQTLYLGNNHLTGNVPTELGKLTKLEELDIATSDLAGPLPTALANLPLKLFLYDDSQLCEPADPAFQNWLVGIAQSQPTHICPTGVATGVIVSSEPYLLRADGVQTSTVTIQIVDVYSNPVALAGQPITLTVDSGTLENKSTATDATGQGTALYRSGLTPAIFPITATVGTFTGAGAVSLVVTSTHRAIDVALIIDSSGSMLTNDPNNLRISAAQAFLGAMQPQDYVTAIDFDHWFRVVSRLDQVAVVRNKLLKSLGQINSLGGTNLGIGLWAGYTQLRQAPFSNSKAAIFLTDGDGAYGFEALLFADAGWPVYTVSLGDEPDQRLLDEIATQTGGLAYHLDSSQQLIAVYLEIASRVAQARMILNHTQLLQPGGTETNGVTIPAGQTSAVFSANWLGSTVDTKLTDPTGRVITSATQDAKITYNNGPTYNLYQILDPVQGEWKVEIFGADLPDGAEDVTVQVLARSDTPVSTVQEKVFLPAVQR